MPVAAREARPVRMVVHKGAPPWVLHLFLERDAQRQWHLARIQVRQHGRPLQTLAVPASSIPLAVTDGEGTTDLASLVSFPDVNFDGWRDLSVLSSNAVLGNSFYHVWIYDPHLRRFRYSAEVSDLTSPQFDARHRRVTSLSRSAAGLDYSARILVWRKQHLVLIQEVEQEPLSGGGDHGQVVQRLESRRIGGRMVRIEKVILSIDRQGREKVLSRIRYR